ncbi:hypothetical protein PN497_19665 [Sphaerospermopsis kisseleviana CS-549]|uniref:Uncharacterized protein n=1 Tax=Sphaerospermopsis kisseleviana CS-549 TaxID=3021783 RepID=A0ABT4ZWB0_9CYAN|nr:hypothetical protein [Sphaerospermopsis kisseleviana]MDB9443554.1 hypothetical protein [Sphaerospermopsis kisseleviana CS-549]BAZ80972.1 hypothetical protein NIES73_22380 [Sphaerospermopsis kisseleviana NIES-73]
MIKQKLTLTLGLISILLGALAASSKPALAGQAPPPGNDIPALIGDTQAVLQILQGGTPTITGISVTSADGGNVIIINDPQIQNNLIAAAAAVISTSTTPESQAIVSLFSGVTTDNLPTVNVSGVPAPLASALISAVNNLIVRDSSGAVISVDINNLETAITAYNNLVLGTAPNDLQALSQDPNFREIRNALETLRGSLN